MVAPQFQRYVRIEIAETMSIYRNLYIAVAITYITALAGAYLNLVYFQDEYLPKGSIVMVGTTIAASAACRLISNTPFITTTVSISLSMAAGMISGIIAHAAINSARLLSTYDPSIYWQSLIVSLVFAFAGAFLGSLGRLLKRRPAGGQHT